MQFVTRYNADKDAAVPRTAAEIAHEVLRDERGRQSNPSAHHQQQQQQQHAGSSKFNMALGIGKNNNGNRYGNSSSININNNKCNQVQAPVADSSFEALRREVMLRMKAAREKKKAASE